MDQSQNKPKRYYVFHETKVLGPFDLEFVEAMILSHNYPPDILICAEDSVDWQYLKNDLTPPISTSTAVPPPVMPPIRTFNNPGPKARITKNQIILGAVVAIGVYSLFVNKNEKPQNTGAETIRPATPPVTQVTSTPSYQPPAYTLPTPTTASSYTRSGTKTYRISDNDNKDLLKRQTIIEAKARELASLKFEAKKLHENIESERRLLDHTNEYAVDRFNDKVNRFNAMNDDIDLHAASYNALVDSYNATLELVGKTVN